MSDFAVYWVRKDEDKFDYSSITEAEMEESEREYQEWAQTPEGKLELDRVHQDHEAMRNNPNRLSKHVDPKDMPMLFARAVQRIWDTEERPCTLREAGEVAGMDADEYVLAAAFAINLKLIRHPTHPSDPMLEAPSLLEPGVG